MYYFPSPLNEGMYYNFAKERAPDWLKFKHCLEFDRSKNKFVVELSATEASVLNRNDRIPINQLTVVSERFADLIATEASEHVCFADVSVSVDGKPCPERFLALGVATEVPVINLECSDYHWVPDNLDPTKQLILYFRYTALRDPVPPHPPIFRDASHNTLVLCSDEFIAECRARKLNLYYLKVRQ